MEIIVVLIGGFLLGIPVIAIIALVRSGNTRRLLDEASLELRDKISDLKGEIAGLRRELNKVSERAGQPAFSPAPIAEAQKVKPADEPAAAPSEAAKPKAHPSPTMVVPEPAAGASASLTAPAPVTQVFLKQRSHSPAPQRIEPAADRNLLRPLPPTTPSQAPPLPSVAAAKSEEHADAGPFPRPEPISTPQPHRATQPSYAPAAPRFAVLETAPPRKSFAERLRATLPLEEVLGMNLFAKLGIILLVLGFALLGRVALISLGAGARVTLIYAAAGALLGGGIRLECKERYHLVGRTGIGGGWALLFFTTYAMYHVPAMTVMSSNTLNCVLMLVVAVAMVAHTLRYKSQLVTGLAFLLAFSTVALSQDSVYALTAGVILALGIVAIALRMGWYELEVFGILASFGNHFYWLYRLYPDGVAGHAFPQF